VRVRARVRARARAGRRLGVLATFLRDALTMALPTMA
jgi:hypothetical protein